MIVNGNLDLIAFGKLFYQIPIISGWLSTDKLHLHVFGKREDLFPFIPFCGPYT